jgi:hypothetical protein
MKTTTMLFSLFLLLLLTACKKESKNAVIIPGGGTIEEGLPSTVPYVDTFIEYRILSGGPGSVGSAVIQFTSELGQYTLGVCYMGTGQIRINQNLWRVLNNLSREELIFHELGHCLFNRYHENSLLPNGRPASIMNQYHLGATIYSGNYRYYLEEFFDVMGTDFFSGVTFNVARYTASSTIKDYHPIEGEDELHYGCQQEGDKFTVELSAD